jgi:glyoxylase-like metal-dependent hydrolase (beta-lactamase superfamily II)
MKLTNNLYFYPERGMLDCNTWLFTGSPGIIFDPGSPDYLAAKTGEMKKDGLDLKKIGIIANTHLHIDHCSANEGFKAISGAKIALHPVQKQHYRQVVIEGTKQLGTDPIEFKEDYLFAGDSFKATEIEMIPSPGHSPDCVCFYLRQAKILICGDVLFDMNTGRVDLPGGNAGDLRNSIDRLSQLDIGLLLPGHMGGVSGAENNQRNFAYIKQNIYQWL